MKAFFGFKTSADMFEKYFYGKAEYRFKIISSFTLQISI